MFELFGRKAKAQHLIDGTTPITGARYVAIDTELTGLDEKNDAIVSLGAVRMTGGTVHLGETLYRLVNPGTGITAESVVIHEITPDDVREQPGIETTLWDFLSFCGWDVLVGHFVSIDLGFLCRGMYGGYPGRCWRIRSSTPSVSISGSGSACRQRPALPRRRRESRFMI
jgi:DNA polymerase III epsilon subunit-like protein